VNIKLTQIAQLSSPLDLTGRPGEPNALYVAEKGGRVRVIRNGNLDPNAVFDLSGEVSGGSEQGLLGITFNSNGSHLYAYITDRGGDVRVLELAMTGGGRREVLFVEHSSAGNHNGGGLQWGSDGMLYAAVGDGGGAGDPEGDAQNLNSRLGKILRINVASGAVAVHEYGLRNPFRFSFDRATGGIWIGDVGQNAWEEVSVDGDGRGGHNFGWNRMEGTHRYNGGTPPPNHTPPVYEYSHQSGGCVVTGGYVYRGSRIPGLVGTYVFIDVCIGDLWGFASGARRSLGPKATQIVSFGQDLGGELYAVSLNGPLYRIDPA
jgi:glucose/arabinose dehydrogenase